MCLVFNARKQTKDVDAIFCPKAKVYKFSKEVASELNLAEDWLNDLAKGFMSDNFDRVEVLNMSHLKIFVTSAKYMLAMKCPVDISSFP